MCTVLEDSGSGHLPPSTKDKILWRQEQLVVVLLDFSEVGGGKKEETRRTKDKIKTSREALNDLLSPTDPTFYLLPPLNNAAISRN